MKRDVRQIGNAIRQLLFLVRFPKESCVVESRSQHALVAQPNESLRITVGIQHRQKMRREFSVCIFNRKIFLVIAHHRDQNFLRQREKLRIKRSQNCRRKLR